MADKEVKDVSDQDIEDLIRNYFEHEVWMFLENQGVEQTLENAVAMESRVIDFWDKMRER